MKIKNLFFLIGVLCIGIAMVLFSKNILEDYKVKKNTELIISEIMEEAEETREISDFKDPKREMPIKEIDGYDYIGFLQIENLDLNLPIMSSWSYPKIKIAPARYQGSVYQNNMIILAHNYKAHFGKIHTLDIGSIIKFTDMDNNEFVYKVSEMEQVGGNDIDKLLAGDWDLTLFTCTLGGEFRVVVRCEVQE
ncbi:MAG: sortase [Lagierella massiliensis]|nr:sortase [Lagierella massiliensis]